MPVFENSVFQNVLILMRSHWDWYVRQMGNFIVSARNHVSSPVLDAKQQKRLNWIGRKEIKEQLLILEESTGINFGLSNTILANVHEMSLVRNIGLHNRWEVDNDYLKKTSSSGWIAGDIRKVEINELQGWSSSLTKLINETSIPIAVKYVAAPDYP
jgi:hypothetical protein